MRISGAAVAFCLALLFGRFEGTALADDAKAGDIVRGEIALGNGAARRVFPLPAGEWRVVRVRTSEGRRAAQRDQLNPPRFVDVALAQTEGGKLVMLMRIATLREPTEIRRWSLQDDPCKRTDVLHRNTYDSSVWASKCLRIDHVAGLRTASSPVYSEVRQWMAAQGLSIPATSLHGYFARFGDYHNLSVQVWTNPGLRNLDSEERAWAANPFHRDWQVKEPERKRYVEEFIAWSEEYMTLLLRDSVAPGQKTLPTFR